MEAGALFLVHLLLQTFDMLMLSRPFNVPEILGVKASRWSTKPRPCIMSGPALEPSLWMLQDVEATCISCGR